MSKSIKKSPIFTRVQKLTVKFVRKENKVLGNIPLTFRKGDDL